jgi:hypothetical protein
MQNGRAVKENNLIFMNGGLDPGVDHMSAMKVMKISDKGENAFI